MFSECVPLLSKKYCCPVNRLSLITYFIFTCPLSFSEKGTLIASQVTAKFSSPERIAHWDERKTAIKSVHWIFLSWQVNNQLNSTRMRNWYSAAWMRKRMTYKHRKSNEVLMTSYTGVEMNTLLFDNHRFSDTFLLSIFCVAGTRQSPDQLFTAVR